MNWKFKTIKNTAGYVFLRRLTIYLTKGSIKLHIITGDDSPVYHNHPWDFTSFILFGGYKEYERVDNKYGLYHNVESRGSIIKYYKTFSINKKLHNQEHRVELFRLWGYKIPAITVGFYSDKLQLCSFCQSAGKCLSNS